MPAVKVKDKIKSKKVQKKSAFLNIKSKKNQTKVNLKKQNLNIPVSNEATWVEEQKIENSKFYLGSNFQENQPFLESRFVFPEGYSLDKITLLVRDPYWLHCYWDLTGDKVEKLKQKYGEETINNSHMVLRVKDITNKTPEKPNSFFDIDIAYGTKSWYVNVPTPNKSYCVELAFVTKDGKYIFIICSNAVVPPRDGVSEVFPGEGEEEWASIEEAYFDRMYALSGGVHIGLSSGELRKKVKEKLESMSSSGGIPSSHIVSGRKEEKGRSFFLVVNTELIVYGVTVPDAQLNIQGVPQKLNPDGTFMARFSLPDGVQNIPVCAISNDKIDKITITPIVKKETK